MQDNNKILVHYDSPNTLGEKINVSLCISNEYGFASDVTALFNRRGEQPGTAKCNLVYDKNKSTEHNSTFSGTIEFDSPGYRTFFISLKLNGKEKEIKYDIDRECAVIAGEGNLAFWECFSHYPFKTPDWIKGAVMYQIFVDTFCSEDLPEEFKDKVVPWDTYPKWRRDPDGMFRNDQRYGGNLKGVIKKLPYIRGLVPKETTIVLYLTPILKSPSQNGYDISDYEEVHEMFGNWDDMAQLQEEAHKLNMKVIVDMVFNHSSNENPLIKEDPEMYSWVHKYTVPCCWWGYENLVEFNQTSERYFENLAKWLQKYVNYMDGVRLDVADSLRDFVLKAIRTFFSKYILGEVWKNAIIGDFREFFYGDELDAVMNYQFAIAIYRYVRWGNYKNFKQIVEGICKLYPNEALAASPIFCTSHDIPRMLNILVGDFMKEGTEYENPWSMERSGFWFNNGQFDTDKFRTWEFDNDPLPEEVMELAYNRQALALFLQYTLPGLPSIFAGDEAGVMGFKDPFNRKPFPWDNINARCYENYRKMGFLRNKYQDVFSGVDFEIIEADSEKMIYRRENLIFLLNRTDHNVGTKYSMNKAAFSLNEVEEEYVLSPYNAVVIEM